MDNSADSSGVAARNSLEPEETSNLETTEVKSSEWTNEKHCLFLKSMESTFVNQLYKSIDLFGWQSHKNCTCGSKSSKHKPTSINGSSSQFKVLRGSCWSKINFRRDESEVDQEEESKVPSTNPWIQHHRNSRILGIRKLPASPAKAPLATSENQNSAPNFQLWSQDSIGSNAEVTDQNFNDEALEEEKSGMIHDMKRTRTSMDVAASNDQVVPFGTNFQMNDVVEDHARVPPKD